MRFFNTAGPVNCNDHYCLDPLSRFDMNEIMNLIDQKKYFVLHAPRQTGKTTALLAVMKFLNQEEKYRCLYINVEAAQAARENVKEAVKSILDDLSFNAFHHLNDPFLQKERGQILENSGPFKAINTALSLWAKESSLPLVILIDEVDSLIGDTLISLLRQIRAGYPTRPSLFPQSIVLCGVRDVRDYRIHSASEKTIITGGSAFNIKAKSLRIGDFTREEVEFLYQCHTEETGQKFASEVMNRVWEYTEGQPWLVNALGYEVCFEMKENRDRTVIITPEMIIEAKENLILRRETHIDQLSDKLQEKRVHQIIEPLLNGVHIGHQVPQDHVQYVIDLGLIKRDKSQGLRISNAIYREVIPREISFIQQLNIESIFQPAWFIDVRSGKLDMAKLMSAFQEFFRQNSESWLERFQYKEAGPQLLMMAFLQRIVNSGGRVEREYGLGRKRVDLFVLWNYPPGIQKIVIELKILYDSLKRTIEEGIPQTNEYMDKCGSDEGHLVIFDRSPDRTWEDKIFMRKEVYKGKKISIWGM